MQNTLTHIKIALGIIGVALIIGYGYYQARNLITGPIITVTSPTHGSTIKQSLFIVVGQAHNSSVLRINNREVSIDEQGNFSEKLLAAKGYTIIEIEAEDRFGRSTKEVREIFSIQEETEVLPPNPVSNDTISEEPIFESPEDDIASSSEPIDLEDN